MQLSLNGRSDPWQILGSAIDYKNDTLGSTITITSWFNRGDPHSLWMALMAWMWLCVPSLFESFIDDFGQEGHEIHSSDGIADNLERVLLYLIVHESSHCTHGGINRWDKDEDFYGFTFKWTSAFSKTVKIPRGFILTSSHFALVGVRPDRNFSFCMHRI